MQLLKQALLVELRLGRRVFLRSEEIERIRQEGLPSLRTQVVANFATT